MTPEKPILERLTNGQRAAVTSAGSYSLILQVCLGKVNDIDVDAFASGYGSSGHSHIEAKRELLKAKTSTCNTILQTYVQC
jgi:hypothetical protein